MKKAFVLLFLILTAGVALTKPSPVFAATTAKTDLCCPEGYDDTWFTCNPVTDLSKYCCRSLGLTGGYEVVSKIPCPKFKTFSLCSVLENNLSEYKSCSECFNKKPPGTWTALGCVPSTPNEFATIFLKFGVGIAGGIAFILILFAAFQMMTSAGNPEQLNAGKELMGAAIAGLLLIIFSIFILRLIGVTILNIPGFK